MMKIDLHVHTKSCKDGEPKSRNIKNSEEFIDIMKESNVGIVSITNHNDFDLEEFDKIFNDEKRGFLLFPGVELDILINGYRKNLNLIVSPENKKDLYDFLNNEKNFNDKKETTIELITKFFKTINAILYLDFKGSKTSFKNENDVSYIEKEVTNKGNFVIVLDFNKNCKMEFIENYHNKNCLIGSDNLCWEKYTSEYSLDLCEYSKQIKDFKTLFNLFKEKKDKNNVFRFSRNFEDKWESFSLKILDSINHNITIPILKNSLNVIFGPKSSGKTTLIKKLYDSVHTNNTKCIYLPHENDLYEKKGKNLTIKMSNFLSERDINLKFQEKKEDILKQLQQIFKYSEKDIKKESFKNFVHQVESKNYINFNIFKKVDSKDFDEQKIEHCKKMIKNINSICKSLNEEYKSRHIKKEESLKILYDLKKDIL